MVPWEFQSTLPHGERLAALLHAGDDRGDISIHAPAWGATGVLLEAGAADMNFNPRSRMGSDRVTSLPATRSLLFQSTLPHGERPGRLEPRRRRRQISIHAPAWGATLPPLSTRRWIMISIHAPAWGATGQQQRLNAMWEFQSTLPHGERPIIRLNPFRRIDFNPRSRMGSDLFCHFAACIGKGFQSTLPHGERHHPQGHVRALRGISIHAPAWGATGSEADVLRADLISIHAPAWGTTRACDDIGREVERFQSTLPHGERPVGAIITPPWICISIHAPAWGATLHLPRSYTVGIFQSTLPHGERLDDPEGQWFEPLISIHAPAWGATDLAFATGMRQAISIHAPAWGATMPTDAVLGVHA